MQASLVSLWRDHGIEPAAAVGHSSGEVTAAYVAGVLALDDAIRISYRLGAVHRRCVGNGTMLAVGLNVRQARRLLAASGSRVAVAAVNAPSSVTLAGEAEELRRIAAKLESENVFCRFLRVDVAYHSPQVEPVQKALRSLLQDLRITRPSIPLYSTVTGRLAERRPWDADYWCSNLRQTVLFEKAVDSMIGAGHRLFVELGAHPVLSPAIRECLVARGVDGTALASMRRGEPERATFFAALDTLLAMEGASVPAGSAPAQRARHGVQARLASGF
jgi:acyl transferase domain-containing protein